MGTLRLTNADRDGVVERALYHTFGPRKDALKAEECRIGLAAYEIAVPKAERQAAAKLSERWLRTDKCLRFRFDFRQVTLNVDPPVLVPSRNRYCEDLGLVQDVELIAAFEAMEAARKTLVEERDRAETGLNVLVRRVSTLRQLRETWPEGEAFYAHLKPRDEAQVPAVIIDDLNRMLGLPAKVEG